MSTQLSRILCARFASLPGFLALFVCAPVVVAAQQVSVQIALNPESNRVAVEVNGPSTGSWSFRDSYAGVLGLGKRIEGFSALDESGAELSTRKLAPGQFEAGRAASHFRYEVNLTPPLSGPDSARVSWLNNRRGLLMLADLLPVFSSKGNQDVVANVRFRLPDGWKAYSNAAETAQSGSVISAIDQTVFAVGNQLRTSVKTESGMPFTLVADGDWAFADGEVVEMTGKILNTHREIFRTMPAKQGTLILFPFAGAAAASQWSAETRGATVTLLIGKLPSKVGALAQLSTPLTHELFHLWVPNALALEGDYDWFYEGFTVYQAARTAVRLDLLTFSEFLNAIARAYDASAPTINALSLIEASGRRWTTGQSSVYSKSLVVAFLYDLRVRSASRGKLSLDNAYRSLFQKYSAGKGANTDGNTASIEALAFNPAAMDFLERFIRRPVTINLATELTEFGLQVETVGLRTRISVSEKLNKHQRDLLRQLGYNDVVRSPRR